MGVFLLWTPPLIWAGLIFYVSHIPSLDSGLGIWDFILRKGAHVFEYSVLTFLLFRAIKGSWPQISTRKIIVWGASSAFLYAVSDEFHQSFVPGRGASPLDVLVDACGIALVSLIYRRIKNS